MNRHPNYIPDWVKSYVSLISSTGNKFIGTSINGLTIGILHPNLLMPTVYEAT